MKNLVLASFLALSLAACSRQGPVDDRANNAAAAEIDVLPPDESAATPTNELESGDDEPTNADNQADAGKIPTALHGRWGLTPGDCTTTNGDAKGLMIVSGDNLQFYEAQAKPSANLKTSGTSISGDFAFTGEGMNWKKYEVLELQKNKLVRTESSPMASYTYARCTS